VVKIETVPPAQEPPKPSISSGQKSPAAPGEIARTPPKYIRAKSKKIVSRDDDSNFFGTPSPSPPAANSTTPRGDPPVLTQGVYRNSLKRPLAAFGNVTNDKPWPPKRRKKMAKDDDFRPDVEMSDACGKIETNKAFSASLPEEGRNNDADLQFAPLSPMDIGNPFIADPSTSPVKKPSRRIDLRKSLDKATRRRRSCISTSTSSISRHSNPSPLPEDREIFNQVGLQKVMAVIAKNYGFDVDVAMKAFLATKSIKKTKLLLQFAKEVTNSATSALLSELLNNDIGSSNGDDGDDEEAPQNMRRGHNNNSSPPPSEKDHQKRSDALTNSGCQKAKRSSDGSRRKSNQLSIKPRPFDEEIDEMALSDYSPPRVSRARQFLRLVKEGRREEAVDRERRRASGAFVAQTQTQALRYDDEGPSQQSSLSNSQALSSPHQPAAVDITRDVKPPIVAPHKEDTVVQQHLEQPPDDNISLPAVEDVDVDQHHHRIFFKRISEGQSSLNEDEDDPEVLKLAQEHRDLVMNVMEDNADSDALHSFEQRHNQDLLRLWSLDWVRQKIADM
jgi:hypothetical protein